MEAGRLGRFVLKRRLGSGAFGVVYEAWDSARSQLVALKHLLLLEASSLYRFKQEFRALADVGHPNLVGLHELFTDGGQWYFTMDLVRGESFLQHVRLLAPQTAEADTLSAPGLRVSLDRHSRITPPASSAFDEARLRNALRQLVLGVAAIHDSGNLHRDLKPSNVLVTEEGRVVVLDFGLVTDTVAGTQRSVDLGAVVGTPGYMAPEQAAGRPASWASDWYAVGVMLYEAMTGALPFQGRPLEILARKQELDPPDPRLFAPELPGDLCQLAMDLLRREPTARPDARDIASRVGAAPSPATPSGAIPLAEGEPILVGREAHLAALEDAFRRSRHGGDDRPVIVYVHGPSGMGKSALLRHFLHELRARARVVVLEGRCYERESVPYKALDSLVDALSRYLRLLPVEEAVALLPRDVHALSRLFPVLRRAEAVARAPGRSDVPDPQELRRRAFGALRELLGRMADQGPLVVSLDDLQWGDADSAALLQDVLTAPDAPALLLLAACRDDEPGGGVLVSALRRGCAALDASDVDVGPLQPAEALTLARELLGPDGDSAVAEPIAREAGGSPLFVHELVRYARAARGAGAAGGAAPSLQELLEERSRDLPEGARALWEVVAVAGRPLPLPVARQAASLGDEALQAAALLRGCNLVRTRGAGTDLLLESAHDRLSQATVMVMAPERLRLHHARLAVALEAGPDPDPEALLLHLRAAGETERALRYAERAAARADDALAFDRAAALYRAALDLAPPSRRHALQVHLGDALANAGRGGEAARTYLEALAGATPAETLVLRRRAAQQFLRGGYIDEGVAALRGVLGAVGLKLPEDPQKALASLRWHRLQLRLRGLRGIQFRERPAEEVPPAELDRIDVCWSAGNGFGGVDLVRAADFQAQHLLLALRAGEPYRIARALAWEAILCSLEGGDARQRQPMLLQMAEELAQRIAHSHALGWAAAAAAVAANCEGRFREATQLCEYAVTLFRGECTDIAWEVGTLQTFWWLPSLWHLGDLDELGRQAPLCAREAEEHGDLYTLTNVRSSALPLLHLCADQPGDARREAQEAIDRWPRGAWHTQHLLALVSQAQASIYEGDGPGALALLAAQRPNIERSLQLRSQNLRLQLVHVRARAALQAASGGRGDRAALREAEADIARLDDEDLDWVRGHVLGLRAALELRQGHRPAAASLLGGAVQAYQRHGMALYEAVARRRHGELTGGAPGQEAVEAADRWMSGAGVRDPARLAAWMLPL